MSNDEMIRSYNEIIDSLAPLLDHELEIVRVHARIQTDRCKRSIRDLTNHPLF